MNLNELIKEYKKVKEKETLVKEEMEKVKSNIKLELEILGQNEYEDETGTKITYKESVRKGYDSKVMKEFLTEEQLESAYKETKFETLRITSKEQRENQKSFMKG